MADIFNMLDTWNAGATVFTGIKLNVTDTASAAGSLLMDLQVGGSSLFNVRKDGRVFIQAGATIRTDSGSVVFGTPGNPFYFTAGTTGTSTGAFLGTGSAGTMIQSGGAYAFASGTDVNVSSSGDTFLRRDAANTLAQRNGVNAQEVRVYKTYTDASNFERVGVGDIPSITGNNGLYFGRAGTGAARNLYIFNESNSGVIFGTNAQVRWQVTSAGTFGAWVDNTLDIGNVSDQRPRNVFIAGYNQLSEMTAPAAPATNNVRIYAEDNGSGKTRLMALFPTGVAQQIAIEP